MRNGLMFAVCIAVIGLCVFVRDALQKRNTSKSETIQAYKYDDAGIEAVKRSFAQAVESLRIQSENIQWYVKKLEAENQKYQQDLSKLWKKHYALTQELNKYRLKIKGE